MPYNKMFGPNLKYDIPAGLVVFLVALPLCLGIAMASGAPLLSGVIAGVVGGLVVGPLSGSPLSVSGPAAGLTVIVLNATAALGSFEALLTAVIIAGVIQLVLGFLRAGLIGYYFPSTVIKGMLAGIGIILILKQVPHALGINASLLAAAAYPETPQITLFQELSLAFRELHPGALLISSAALGLMIFWDIKSLKRFLLFKHVPGPLLVVFLGIGLNELFKAMVPAWALTGPQLVQIPQLLGPEANYHSLSPNWQALGNITTWTVAVTIAIVASLESLLSLEAADKLDPYKRISPPSRELKAQGLANVVSGLLGGLPVTAVIVRSSANVTAGARTKVSAVVHGLFLGGFVLLTPGLLNHIPLACLAAILLFIGYKLSTVGLYRGMLARGWAQFLPFIVTVVAIVFTDLLTGIGIGLVVAFFFILRNNYENAFTLVRVPGGGPEGKDHFVLKLAEEVSYLNKGAISKCLRELPVGCSMQIDGSVSTYIDYDVLEVIQDFKINAPSRDIALELTRIPAVQAMAHD